MKLPDSFQMRVKGYEGFTNTVKKNDYGDYYVKWARGYDREYWMDNDGKIPFVIYEEDKVKYFVSQSEWVIVDETPKHLREAPDEFYFRTPGGSVNRCVKCEDGWNVFWSGFSNKGTFYEAPRVHNLLKNKDWTIVNAPKPLTSEQVRANKEFREQVAALEQSIKIQQQTVAHHERMIGNYSARIEDLKAKIVEEV